MTTGMASTPRPPASSSTEDTIVLLSTDTVSVEGSGDDGDDGFVRPGKKKRICRSTYKGVSCSKEICTDEHPSFCTRCTTPENRVAGCKLGWHSRHLHMPKNSGNNSSGMPKKSGNASRRKRLSSVSPKGNRNCSNNRTNDVINLKRRLDMAELKQLRTELALEKAKRTAPASTAKRSYAMVTVPNPPVTLATPPAQPGIHQAIADLGRLFTAQLAALAASYPH